MRHLHPRAGAILAVMALLGSALPAFVRPAAAAEYTLESNATYTVRPDERDVAVQVELTFTNTTPDPAGRFSIFDELRLAIHDQAAGLTASDADGALEAAAAVEDDVNVATIELRDGLRFEDSVTVALDYTLPDGADTRLRVRPSVVVFPAWSFGTSGRVRVSIPAGYEVRVDGDPLSEDGAALTSGAIADPAAWLALVTAVRPAEYTELSANVPLQGGTADLLVRAFADDEPWGERVRALVGDALPRIEQELGLPYPHRGQLVLTETVAANASGFGEGDSTGTEILIAYDQPYFTALHQVAHVWLPSTLVDARWIREGLASHAARVAGADIGVDPPFDAAAAVEAAESPFALDTWSPSADVEAEAFGYAASWALIEEIEAAVGADALRAALARAAASRGPYEGGDIDPAPTDGGGGPTRPLTSRSFLDQLEAVADADLGELFGARVLNEADVALLPLRGDARAAFDTLVAAADGWGAPDPVRGAMGDWAFDEATAAIASAGDWLELRDDLLAAMEAAGLAAPDRLQQAYRAYGGGPEAVAELDAEHAVVDAYASTADTINAPRSFVERLGLIGGPDPEAELRLANGRFADGDLSGALDAITEAQRLVAAAGSGGIVRLVSLALVVLVLVAVAVVLFRRQSTYTPAR